MLRQHANCRLCFYAKEGNKVVSRRHANCRLYTYVRKSCVTACKSSRLRKPDNGNRTSEASEEAKPKRTEGKRNCDRKGQRNWNKDINSQRSEQLIPASSGVPIKFHSPPSLTHANAPPLLPPFLPSPPHADDPCWEAPLRGQLSPVRSQQPWRQLTGSQ
jgi:hypothetical protein